MIDSDRFNLSTVQSASSVHISVASPKTSLA